MKEILVERDGKFSEHLKERDLNEKNTSNLLNEKDKSINQLSCKILTLEESIK